MRDDSNAADVRHLLAAGGMARASSPAKEPIAGLSVSRFQYGRDPGSTDVLGRMLAELVGEEVDVVLTWEGDDAVLAHVLARELQAITVVAFDEGGLAFLSNPLPSSARVAIVADAFRGEPVPRTLIGLVAGSGGTVVAACCLAATSVLDSLDLGIKRYSLVTEVELDLAPTEVDDL